MSTYTTLKCTYCQHTFQRTSRDVASARGHHTQNTYCSKNCFDKAQNTKIRVQCLQCNIFIERTRFRIDKMNGRVFCSQSCAATYNNFRRDKKEKVKKEEIIKICKQCQNNFVSRNKNYKRCKICVQLSKPKIIRTKRIDFKCSILGDYSKLVLNNCAHCKIKFVNEHNKKYCNECVNLYSRNGRTQYAFTFNVFKYPRLFNLDLVKQLKFWSPLNKLGLTRDHKVSVTESIRNGYDSYYIKHPLNCQLMTFKDNYKKFTTSSMSYEQLKLAVDSYDKSGGKYPIRTDESNF